MTIQDLSIDTPNADGQRGVSGTPIVAGHGGTDITMRDCELLNIYCGFSGNGGGQGFLMQGNVASLEGSGHPMLNLTIGTINSIEWIATGIIGSGSVMKNVTVKQNGKTKCCCYAYAKHIEVKFILNDRYTFHAPGNQPFQWIFGDGLGGQDYDIHNEWTQKIGPEMKKICS